MLKQSALSAFRIQPSAFSGHACLGLRLEQLSIGHLFLLADASSPFLHGAAASTVDLSNAVFICSQPWDKSSRDSGRWWFRFFLKAWARRCRAMDFGAEQARFAAYFRDETDFPLAKMDHRSVREYGSPWWWRLLAIMMADFHLTERDAMDMAAMKAAMLFSARGEAEGKLKLWSEADANFEEFCRKMDGQDVQFPPAAN